MENFTPISALLGGVLIGLASVLLLWFNGKILGVSGIVAQVLANPFKSTANIVFLIGVILGVLIYKFYFDPSLKITLNASLPIIALGGFLVGFGTRLGGGCTSGHGICGIARFSIRSILATLTFMAAGILTVLVMKILLGG